MALAKRLVLAAVSLSALGLALACVLPWIPIWPFVLFAHFRVQYVELGVLIVICTALLRLRGYFDIAMIATLLHALSITADLTAEARTGPRDGKALRVLLLNVHTESTGFARVRQLIADEKPDLIGLVEVDQHWLEELAPALAGYPGRIEEPRPDNFGIALYARGDVQGSAMELGSSLPTVVANVTVDQTRLSVIVTHPLPPMNGAAVDQQRAQFDAIADQTRSATPPVLVMGDFNTTPWSRLFQRLLGRSGLCDSRAGFGVQASFPAASALLRIPIDHVLLSCTVGVRDRRIGPDVGSDHLPVIVDLVFPR
ncbi:MAG TPA: endonuclease/exonuclease/phosphatase family protein [Kofleriaceae bacterium]|nr:endonuclease/exonuclease/phosphatase family protein [Kofleriaceae bacterium]